MHYDETESDRRMEQIGRNGNDGLHYDFVSPDVNVEVVRQKLLDRSRVGLEKYGVTTMRTDLGLPEWLIHLQEELLDASVYVQAQHGRMVAAEALIRLLRSYNPDLAMGEGMKAQFLALREVLDQ